MAYAGRDCRQQLTVEVPALLKSQGVIILPAQTQLASTPETAIVEDNATEEDKE